MIKKLVNKIPIRSRWRLTLRIVPLLVVIILLKFITHHFEKEFLALNFLFVTLISANIFLIGFLVSGVLADYKESEKLPDNLAASLETMADEGFIVYKNKKSQEAKNFLLKLTQFNKALLNWFYKKEKTENLMKKLYSFNDDFLALESQMQPQFITRLKQEQNSIRKTINRIHTIRETSFVESGYVIVEIISFILIVGLIFTKIEPFYEAIFFISFISFLLIYMVYFIRDLDNPFGYYDENNLIEVSLKPLLDSQKRIKERLKECENYRNEG